MGTATSNTNNYYSYGYVDTNISLNRLVTISLLLISASCAIHITEKNIQSVVF